MNIAESNIPSPDPRQAFLSWYSTSGFGKALHKLEAEYLLNHLQFTYNQSILQVGWLDSENRFVRPYFERGHIVVDARYYFRHEKVAACASELNKLPLADDSVDVVIIPHVLEFEADPHGVLSEMDRF